MRAQRPRGRGGRRVLGALGAVAAGLGLASDVASGERVADEVIAGAAPDERADVTPGTVVLLHGLARGARHMRILEWRLAARGYRVCNLDYDTRVADFDHALDAVRRSLLACVPSSGRIDFVTHSLGGLVLRGLLDRHPEPRAGRAVLLAPPNGGSEIADRLASVPLLARVIGPLAGHLGTGAQDLPRRLPGLPIPVGVIAGSRWINHAGPLWLPTPHDGTVSVESTRLAGMSDHLVLPYTHTFIMNPAEVADQVDAFLRRGRFERPPEAEGRVPRRG